MPLSWLYGAIANARNTLYQKGVFKQTSLNVPTISVGNITTGGTGKTPLVAFIAEMLAASGERVCILTRGYGRKNPERRVLVSDRNTVLASPAQAGDEPFELARKLIGKAFVVADANRVSAGIWARDKFEITVFILDDAFQHQRIKRDLNIVTIDASNPFGSGKTLPFGILREPLGNLKRADLIVITRSNFSDEILHLKTQILKHSPDGPIILSENNFRKLTDLKQFCENFDAGEHNEKGMPKIDSNARIHAFCALGNPGNFFDQLKRENYQTVSSNTFPDHHFYDQNDIAKIERTAVKAGADVILTTVKDAVKLKGLEFRLPCFVAENAMSFDDEKKLRQTIGAVCS